MATFADVYRPKPEPPKPSRPKAPHFVAGLCELCGFMHEDVLLGVCRDCAPPSPRNA